MSVTTAFKELRDRGFFARQNFSCCQRCAGYEVACIASEWRDNGKLFKGCVYSTGSDYKDARAGRDFYLAFGMVQTKKHGQLGLPDSSVGVIVVDTLERHGVKVEWSGSPHQRIKVLNGRSRS